MRGCHLLPTSETVISFTLTFPCSSENQYFNYLSGGPLTAHVTPTCDPYIDVKKYNTIWHLKLLFFCFWVLSVFSGFFVAVCCTGASSSTELIKV